MKIRHRRERNAQESKEANCVMTLDEVEVSLLMVVLSLKSTMGGWDVPGLRLSFQR